MEDNISVSQLLNIKIDEFTSPCSVIAELTTPLPIILKIFDQENIRHLPIIENNKAIGILSDRDVRIFWNKPWAVDLVAQDIMIKDPYSVIEGSNLIDVVYEMSKNKIGSALVENNEGETVGIFTSIDALNALIEILRGEIPQ